MCAFQLGCSSVEKLQLVQISSPPCASTPYVDHEALL